MIVHYKLFEIRVDALKILLSFSNITKNCPNTPDKLFVLMIFCMLKVNILQQESRNMDSRVSQLYTQLLHEIINKRDNSLEMRELQNKLLNHTVDYHKLKVRTGTILTQHLYHQTCCTRIISLKNQQMDATDRAHRQSDTKRFHYTQWQN